MALPAQTPPQTRHLTYDFTGGAELVEVGADVKAPGDGIIYSVFTADVQFTDPSMGPLFSNSAIEPATGLSGSAGIQGSGLKQVVVLQAVNATTQAIQWQRYYYGTGPQAGAEDSDRPTNARGISVWAGDTAESTRIAICGEHWPGELPLDQSSFNYNVNCYKGFIAVFDGNGSHRWSRNFYLDDVSISDPRRDLAVTDVCIRVVDGIDIVTYCGILHGGLPQNASTDPGSASAMPVSPFSAPTGSCSFSHGAADNGQNQWDGFVGRVTFNSTTQTQSVVFHSIVGGGEQDGLFGIDEIDEHRFAVVGSTGAPSGPAGGLSFPFTDGTCSTSAPSGAPYAMATLLVFNAQSGLVLEDSRRLSAFPTVTGQTCPHSNEHFFTVARDVVVQRHWDSFGSGHLILAAGSTNECSYQIPGGIPGGTYGGGNSDGFIAGIVDITGIGISSVFSELSHAAGDDGFTGIQSWNEFSDHFGVVGFTGGSDIEARSYIREPSVVQITAMHTVPLGTAPAQRPTRMGFHRATNNHGLTYSGITFEEYGLGDPAGGGISVDSSARFHVIGAKTSGNGYPVVGGGRSPNDTADAVRAALDMLPAGVGRTDGTVAGPTSWAPTFPLSGFFGGTTPECALGRFGRRIGQPVPALRRMMIDYEGAAPAPSVVPNILIDRPPDRTNSLFAVHLTFPGNSIAPTPLNGMLIWTNNNPIEVWANVPGTDNDLLRIMPGAALPSGTPNNFTFQFFAFVTNPVPGGNTGPTCANPQGATVVASPALWISY